MKIGRGKYSAVPPKFRHLLLSTLKDRNVVTRTWLRYRIIANLAKSAPKGNADILCVITFSRGDLSVTQY